MGNKKVNDENEKKLNKDITVVKREWIEVSDEEFKEHEERYKNIALYHDFLKENDYTPKTIHIYQKEIFYFWNWLIKEYDNENIRLEDVRLKHAKEYEEFILEEEEFKDSTFNKKRQSLYNFYEFLKENGEVKVNPFEKITHKRIENRRKTLEYLNKSDYMKIDEVFNKGHIWKKDHIRIRDKAIYTVLKDLGLKVQEATNLKKDDIDRQNMLLHVGGDRERVLPLPKETLKVIGEWLEVDKRPDSPYIFTSQKSDKITQNTIHILINKLKDESGVENLTANILRNTKILSWRKEGLGTKEVKRRAGHKNTITTRYYFERYKRN